MANVIFFNAGGWVCTGQFYIRDGLSKASTNGTWIRYAIVTVNGANIARSYIDHFISFLVVFQI